MEYLCNRKANIICYVLYYCRILFNLIQWLIIITFCCFAKQFTRSRLVSLIKILSVYIVTLAVLFTVCQKLPYSFFYRSYGSNEINFARIRSLNNQRRSKAREVLSELNPSGTRRMYLQNGKSDHLTYAIGVVTVARKNFIAEVGELEYLTQVMTQLHDVIAKHGATNYVFPFMCNVDLKPEDFYEALHLAQYFPNETKLYSSTYQEGSYKRTGKMEMEKQDYVFCLESALEYNPDYVILIEDDAYPKDNFLEVLEHLIETKLETNIRRGERTLNTVRWGWVKLMIPYSLTKYHRNWFFFCQWVALALLLSGIVWLAHCFYIECCSSTRQSANIIKTSSTSFCVLLLFTFIYFLLIIWIIGRAYYVQVRSFSPYLHALEPGTSCCTQAVLFQSSEVPSIVKYLRSIKCSRHFPLDFALDNYRIDNNIKQYLVSPNIFSHIGFYSSIRQSFNTNEAEFV
ncbi:post-GPI attachment to proteins factor 4-like [Amphiura filiformis]|uniref:post-GPI attachment to proteins factor 4-like n=1 Tax=Amphiura filiformis TaxID=82378 RepID=UPI003B223FE5